MSNQIWGLFSDTSDVLGILNIGIIDIFDKFILIVTFRQNGILLSALMGCVEETILNDSKSSGGILLIAFLKTDEIWNLADQLLRCDDHQESVDRFYSTICACIDAIRNLLGVYGSLAVSHSALAARLNENLTVFILIGAFLTNECDIRSLDPVCRGIVHAVNPSTKFVIADLYLALNCESWGRILNLFHVYTGNIEMSLYYISHLGQSSSNATIPVGLELDIVKEHIWTSLLVIFTRFSVNKSKKLLDSVLGLFCNEIPACFDSFFSVATKEIMCKFADKQYETNILRPLVFGMLSFPCFEKYFDSNLIWFNTFLVAFNVGFRDQASFLVFHSARMPLVAQSSLVRSSLLLMDKAYQLMTSAKKDEPKSRAIFGDNSGLQNSPICSIAKSMHLQDKVIDVIGWSFIKLAYLTECNITEILSKLILEGTYKTFYISVLAACSVELVFLQKLDDQKMFMQFTYNLMSICISEFTSATVLDKETESLSIIVCRYLSTKFPPLVVSSSMVYLHKSLDNNVGLQDEKNQIEGVC